MTAFARRIRRGWIVAAAATLTAAVSACGIRDAESPPNPPRPADPTRPPALDFSLTDHRGEPFRLGEHRGRPVVLFFGYTYCPDICPTTLSAWAAVEEQLGDAARDVTFAFVTVDPERDSAARLAKHLGVFSSRFLGLRGAQRDLEAVWKAYGAEPRKVVVSEGASGYLVDHPTQMVLLDRAGRLARRLDYARYPAEITEAILSLLAESTLPLVVTDAWSWPTAPGGNGETREAGTMNRGEEVGPGVVYATVRNNGSRPEVLLSARSEVCEVAELHETVAIGGRMRMRHLADGLEIPPGGAVELKPGAHHLMLLGLRRDLRPGERFDVVLTFRDAGDLIISSAVDRP